MRDVHQLLLSVCNRLDAIEGDLVCKIVDVEKSLEVAHSKIENLECTVSKLQTRIQTVERSYNEQRQLDELRSKEYNILLHGITQNSTIETTDQIERTVRTFIVEKLRFSQDRMDEIQFCNIYRLPRRTSAIQSTPDVSSLRSGPIVIKLARITDKMTLLKLAQNARQHNANMTRHLPLSMQKQRASLLKSASSLYKAGRKIQWKTEGSNYCLYADGERVLT